MVDLVQPDAAPLSDSLIDSVLGAVTSPAPRSREVVFRGQHSNDVVEVRLDDGRTLMVKRGRYGWAADRFATSRRAAELLTRDAGARVPTPIDLPDDLHDRPLEVYWRVDLPTLSELWPGLDAAQRRGALRSWGALLRRVHRVRFEGCGPLHGERPTLPLGAHLEADLAHRLLPAIYAEWGEAPYALVQRLLEHAPAVAARAAARPPTLVHGDLHAGNVLCEASGGEVRCVGLLDLETASAGPAEADLAGAEVLHGPLFGQPLEESWIDSVLQGYGGETDPVVRSFYRAWHLANQGFYSALVGHREHAALIHQALCGEVTRLQRRPRS